MDHCLTGSRDRRVAGSPCREIRGHRLRPTAAGLENYTFLMSDILTWGLNVHIPDEGDQRSGDVDHDSGLKPISVPG